MSGKQPKKKYVNSNGHNSNLMDFHGSDLGEEHVPLPKIMKKIKKILSTFDITSLMCINDT
jgi:hypothetical protein